MVGHDRVFVDCEYVPIAFKFKHPWDMQKVEIVEFFYHLWLRQEKYTSLKEVFQFKKITDSRKQNARITDPLYNISDPNEASPNEPRWSPMEYEEVIYGRVVIPVLIYFNVSLIAFNILCRS